MAVFTPTYTPFGRSSAKKKEMISSDIISFLYDNYESTKYILNQYDNCKDKYQFSKLIINEYLTHINKTNNLSNIPNQKLKKLIQK